MRFVVYDDHVYERIGEELWTDRTFPLFIAEVGQGLQGMVLLGRLRPTSGEASFRMPPGVEFVPLPFYASLASPWRLIKGAVASLKAFWRSLDDVDGAWILGPHPLGVAFALMTLARRRRVVLGVRQELRTYARNRHPGRHSIHLAADLLESFWIGLARIGAVVVVGPELKLQYRKARRLHELFVSMTRRVEIAPAEAQRVRRYEGRLTALSVGRLDAEKNPLMLADVLAGLRETGRDWRLLVCGTGSCEAELAEKLQRMGLAEHAELKGYVPLGAGLRELYAEAHAFLHVSWTEGVPQVLFEAFAARLPVVATDVGGVGSVAGGGAAIMIPPGDPAAATEALERIASDGPLREELTEAGAAQASRHSFEAEAAATAAFLSG